jgi:SAM-dependent methyltransferase
MNKKEIFDQHASNYDAWFMDNTHLLLSEAKLVAYFLKNVSSIFSVGCGSGLFESILKKEFDIHITHGLEPSEGMANIARKRGVDVAVSTAEDYDFGENKYDCILFNGTPSYINDLKTVLEKAHKALLPKGKIILIDVPKESGYGTLYNLAKTVGSWDHSLLKDIHPAGPYPIEFVQVARWRTTQEKIDFLLETGFSNLKFAQTLTQHPLYSNQYTEEPIEGYTKGDYVAICATKQEEDANN